LQTKAESSSDAMKQLEKDCRQNSLSLALLCMQKALLLSNSNAGGEIPKNCIEVCMPLRTDLLNRFCPRRFCGTEFEQTNATVILFLFNIG